MSEGWRFFTSTSGFALPLKLINPLDDAEMGFRNTFYRARFDECERVVAIDKVVHGDVHMTHRYEYAPHGTLRRAEIVIEDDVSVIDYDDDGRPIR